jgi:hypothetical protein
MRENDAPYILTKIIIEPVSYSSQHKYIRHRNRTRNLANLIHTEHLSP